MDDKEETSEESVCWSELQESAEDHRMEGPGAFKAQSKGQQTVSGEVHSFYENTWMCEFILEHELQLFKGRRMKRKVYCRDTESGKGSCLQIWVEWECIPSEAGSQGWEEFLNK